MWYDNHMNTLPPRCALIPLAPWLEAAQAADIPRVPATPGPEFPVADIGRARSNAPVTPAFRAACQWLEAQCDADREWPMMLRWDCGAPSALRETMRTDGRWREEYLGLVLDDDIILDRTPFPTTRWWLRPWVAPALIDGIPLVVRAFIDPAGAGGGHTGSLALRYSVWPDALRVSASTLQLTCDAALLLAPHLPAEAIVDGYTADFLITDSGLPVFLDGGPPYLPNQRYTADPCHDTGHLLPS
jgi:hypothetical protein